MAAQTERVIYKSILYSWGKALSTYSKFHAGHLDVPRLQPLIELLGIVCRVTFSICGHTEYSQSIIYLSKAWQVLLETM